MDRDELISFLKENLSVEMDFRQWHWGGSNELTVTLKLGEETISTATETINWRDDSKDDY